MIYFRVGRPAHATVLYGVHNRNIYVMDPMPGRGLTTLAPNYFLTLGNAHVVLGFSLLLELSRGIATGASTFALICGVQRAVGIKTETRRRETRTRGPSACSDLK